MRRQSCKLNAVELVRQEPLIGTSMSARFVTAMEVVKGWDRLVSIAGLVTIVLELASSNGELWIFFSFLLRFYLTACRCC
jgi:hypothetical protein